MKKLSFFALAMAGMLFTACADKDVVAEDVQPGEVHPDGYMSLNINLPTTPVTRAPNDVFDDGLPEEYKVTDCALLLFQGDDAESATLINAQQVLMPFDDTIDDEDDDNITISYLATAKVRGYVNGNKLFALAMLNYKNLMTIDKDGIPTIGGETLSDETTLKDLRNLKVKVDDLASIKAVNDASENLTTRGGSMNYFFMTNAILSDAKGGAAAATAPQPTNVIQLAEMDTRKIKETAEEAKQEPAGEIFVERAVAKATLTVNSGALTIENLTEYDADEEKSKPAELKIVKTSWVIDNMEPESFVARNPGDLSYIGYTTKKGTNYRFVGHTSTKEIGNTFVMNDYYRSYWCVDPQYDVPAVDMVPAPADSYVATDEDHPLYCYENTFNVKNQSYINTTRAIIKVELDKGTTFWTLNGGTEMYPTKESATSYVLASVVNNTEVVNAFKDGLKPDQVWDIDKNSFKITDYYDEISGIVKVSKIELGDAVEAAITAGTTFKPEFKAAITKVLANEDFISTLNSRYVVREYKNGVMYYAARFQHFANDLAPWNSKEAWEDPAPAGGSTLAAYPNYNEPNYLGRYGMVRNNWYYVEVIKFNKLGYPTDPSGQVNNEDFDDPDTPDDNIEEYISAKIHVLSWAKREQQWGF